MTIIAYQGKKALGKSTSILNITAAVLLILYIIYQITAASSDRITTDVVRLGSEKELYHTSAVIVRDENVITAPGGQYLISYMQSDGERVNVNSKVAKLYAIYGDAETRNEFQSTLNSLDRQIRLARSVDVSTDSLSVLSDIRKELRENMMASLTVATAGGSIGKIEEDAYAVLNGLNRDAALTDQRSSMQSLIFSLEAMKTKLLGSMAAYGQDVDTGGESGTFFTASHVDGYESIFTKQTLPMLDYGTYLRWMNTSQTVYGDSITVVGKLVRGFTWNMILPVTQETADALTVGDKYSVTIDNDGVTVSMTLDRIVKPVADGSTLLIFSSMDQPADLSYTRFSDVSLALKEIEGYRVPITALHEVDGQTGVYILDGGRVSFRAVQIETQREGYVLVHIPTAQEKEENSMFDKNSYLQLKDLVITDGDDLYDGKYID